MRLSQMKSTKMADILRHTFVTSDHHFGSWQLPEPFIVFSQEQEKELIEKWNLVVGKDDIVYYNGDFADCNVQQLCDYARQLNGHIILVKGNHDTLPIDVYKAIFKDVVDRYVIDDLDLLVHHCPGPSYGKREVFGHLHRTDFFKTTANNQFCSCVQFHDGFPVSLEQVLLSFK